MIIITLIALATGQDCGSWETLNDCTALTSCFWTSQFGGCEVLSDWTRSRNDHSPSRCTQNMIMSDCYQLVHCFWVAHQGSCEDIKNWDPIVTVNKDQPCSSWKDENKCWDVEKCFWNGRTNACQEMSGAVETVNAAATTRRPTRKPTRKPTRRTTSTTPIPQPCSHWLIEKECWDYNECFWNGRTHICSEMGQMPPSHTDFVPSSTTRKVWIPTTTQKPTPQPTEIAIPMNLCETIKEEPLCSENEDCVYDRVSGGCFATSDGDCSRLPTEVVCGQNEDCRWSHKYQNCQSECDGYRSARQCSNGEDCIWSSTSSECLSLFASCDRFKTNQNCILNEVCFWDVQSQSCTSYFSPCDRMQTPQDCAASAQFNEKCTWDEDPVVEDLFGCQDPFTTAPPIVECDTIPDELTCVSSNATETNMPCVWEADGFCVEFQFDCEDFLTQRTCDGASFREVTCFWNGECDEMDVLQSARRQPESAQGENDPLILWKIGLAGFLFGMCLTLACKVVKKKSHTEDITLALM